jgi:hypothetical protein
MSSATEREFEKGVLEVDLVRADAEATNDNQVFGFGEDAGGELSFRPNAENVNISKERGY